MTLSTWSSLLSKNLLTVLNATSQASLLGNLQAPVPMQGNACIQVKLYIWTKWSYYWPQVVLDHHVQTRCVTSLEGLCWSSVVRWNSWYDIYKKFVRVFSRERRKQLLLSVLRFAGSLWPELISASPSLQPFFWEFSVARRGPAHLWIRLSTKIHNF